MRKFTLIELLVVIAIIGILISILMPSLVKARYAGYSAVCINNLKNISIASNSYAGSNNESFMYDTALTSWNVNNHNYGLPMTSKDSMDIGAYYNSETDSANNKLICPGYTNAIDYRGKSPFVAKNGQSTNTNNDDKMVRTYRLNDWMAAIPTSHTWNNSSTNKPVASMSRLRSASDFIIASESHGKNLMIQFGEMYYNPIHNSKSPASKADGSVRLYKFDNGSAGIPWAPNSANSSYAVDTWGTYLHPSYSGNY